MILPGSTLGMLGGGQLGRMFTVAARTMGYRVMVLDPDPSSPAGRMADEHLRAGYNDEGAIGELIRSCAVVTTEFENVPAETLERLADHLPVRPAAGALRRAQDRIREKAFLQETGLPTAPFRAIADLESLVQAWEAIGPSAILKRAAFGYDGKGQAVMASLDEGRRAFEKFGSLPCVLERKVELTSEISVVLARSVAGETGCYPVAENVHRGGILHTSLVPARVPQAVAEQARDMAARIAVAMDYVGVLAVEFFVTTGGELLVNEIAPRPHNSGHYTLDACETSQFEQQVRMVCGLPFGDMLLVSPVVMVNLLGDLWDGMSPDWSCLLEHPRAKLHLYGKLEARPGRKMGHYCVLADDAETALAEAEAIFGKLARR